MSIKVETLYSDEHTLSADISGAVNKNPGYDVQSIHQVVMMLMSRMGAQAIVSTIIYKSKTA